MVDQFIHTEEKDGVFIITMDDARTRNALGPEMTAQMHEALDTFEADPRLRVLVLTGQDPAFCSGANVRGFQRSIGEQQSEPQELPTVPWERMEARHSLSQQRQEQQSGGAQFMPWRLWQIQKPTIAAVNGFAYGIGSGLTLSCDIRIASENAVFSESFIRMGLIPADGSCWQLPRLIGLSNTLLVQYTGDRVEASEAYLMGLVSRVVPHQELMPSVMELAARLAHGPTFSMGLIKYLVHQGLTTDLRTSLEAARSAMSLARQTEDHKEGVQAFIEKREPVFQGR